jgi:hypothetical protein
MDIRSILNNTKTAFIRSWPIFIFFSVIVFVGLFIIFGTIWSSFGGFQMPEGQVPMGEVPQEVRDAFVGILVFFLLIMAFIVLTWPFYHTGIAYAQLEAIKGEREMISRLFKGGKKFYGKSLGLLALYILSTLLTSALLAPCAFCFLSSILFGASSIFSTPTVLTGANIAEMQRQMQIEGAVANLILLPFGALISSVFQYWLYAAVAILATGTSSVWGAFRTPFYYLTECKDSRKLAIGSILVLSLFGIVSGLLKIAQAFIPIDIIEIISLPIFAILLFASIAFSLLIYAFFSAIAYDYSGLREINENQVDKSFEATAPDREM